MKINIQTVEHVANLSRLHFEKNELEQYQNRLNVILDYVNKLNEVDTIQIEPTAHVLPLKNVMRKDETIPSLPRDQALANAPEQEDGYFKVAKIMES